MLAAKELLPLAEKKCKTKKNDLSIQCASAFQINPSFETFSYNLLAVVNILKSSIHDRISEKGIRAIYLLHEVSSFHDTYCACI